MRTKVTMKSWRVLLGLALLAAATAAPWAAARSKEPGEPNCGCVQWDFKVRPLDRWIPNSSCESFGGGTCFAGGPGCRLIIENVDGDWIMDCRRS
jgi:hypothetical protein